MIAAQSALLFRTGTRARVKCQKCHRPMTALFYSYACDYCDGLVEERSAEEGYVVWRDRPLPADEYVFQTKEHALTWRSARGLEECPIVLVRSPHRFRWRKSTGSVKDIVTADRLVTIYPNDQFPPEANRAYVCS
jgi:hypothetical protein